MSIKRYTADANNTITNAYGKNLINRMTASNMGLADSLEIFNIYAQASTSSVETAATLIKFPISTISSDRTAKTIPVSGKVSFYLRMFNVKHSQTLPKDFTLSMQPLYQTWDEGRGVDLDEYTDIGASNWVSASSTTSWYTTDGATETTGALGSVHSNIVYTSTFTQGYEDLEVDITTLVEQWIAGTKTNYGLLVRLSGTAGDGLSTTTRYTKKFSARGSEFFFKRPVIEARWDSRVIDERGAFYYSSSLAPAADNVHRLYLYNFVRGKLQNIPGASNAKNEILVSLYSGSADNSGPSGSKLVLYDGNYNITGGMHSTGIYTASVGITASATPLTHLFDVWHSSSQGASTITEFMTGTIKPIVEKAEQNNPDSDYVLSITNQQQRYMNSETARFRLFTRHRNWSPNIYTRTTADVRGQIIQSASYMVYRVIDDLDVISYGTGSDYHTFMSYDNSGSFFDIDMSMLEYGYQYGLKIAFYDDSVGSWQEQPYTFKFRVEAT